MLKNIQSALFIGRFQPFHNGHLDVIKQILQKNERVIIVIGSAEKNYLPDNPLTAGERFDLIDKALKEAKIPAEKYCIVPVRNVNNYAIWVNHINTYVPPYTKIYTGSKIVKACYNAKYNKAYIAKSGPEIIHVKRNKIKISATKIREAILKGKKWEQMVSPIVSETLKKWQISSRLADIKETMDFTRYNNEY